jgi:hypothetical protein
MEWAIVQEEGTYILYLGIECTWSVNGKGKNKMAYNSSREIGDGGLV